MAPGVVCLVSMSQRSVKTSTGVDDKYRWPCRLPLQEQLGFRQMVKQIASALRCHCNAYGKHRELDTSTG